MSCFCQMTTERSGKVLVTGKEGTTLLEKNQDGVLIDSPAGKTIHCK